MMKLTILDYKQLPDRGWILCRGNLLEYLENLKEDFYKFSIQRKIVKNQYLDTLISTIEQRDPIPIITLTYNDKNIKVNVGDILNINMQNVEILDGLQRTFRLWAYYTL